MSENQPFPSTSCLSWSPLIILYPLLSRLTFEIDSKRFLAACPGHGLLLQAISLLSGQDSEEIAHQLASLALTDGCLAAQPGQHLLSCSRVISICMEHTWLKAALDYYY